MGEFDPLFAVLGDGLFAAYLLGRYHVKEQADLQTAQFADPVDMNFDVPPEEAIRYFRSKRVVGSKQFYDLRDEARAAAFTVGGLYREDVLEAFKEEIAVALEEGTPQREVIAKFRSILEGAGHEQLGEFHLETVFRTNVQMAYGVGRRQGMEEIADLLPYWQYSAVLDDRTRPTHRALDGLTLPANHPFWDTHYPPWGWNCRCVVTAVGDVPRGYNHRNPSGEAELAYDKSGSPVKAEHGTAVYDFSAGRFSGVPPQGSLGEVIEAGVERARKDRKR